MVGTRASICGEGVSVWNFRDACQRLASCRVDRAKGKEVMLRWRPKVRGTHGSQEETMTTTACAMLNAAATEGRLKIRHLCSKAQLATRTEWDWL